MERTVGSGDVGRCARIAVYSLAIELTEEELAIVAGNIVVQGVAANDVAFVEAVVIVDRNRLDLGYALNVQSEQAKIGMTAAVGDLVRDLLLDQFTIGEADLGSVAQDI